MLDSFTSDTLRKAVMAAQSGDTVRAQKVARDALEAGGDIAALHAFLGMLVARSGDFTNAVNHLKLAHAAKPDDNVIAINLIAALIDTKDLHGAINVATDKRARADPSMRIARYRGYTAQTLERYSDAVEAYEYVLTAFPDDFETWNNLGNARSAIGDLEGSVAALERAMKLNTEALPTRLNLAVAYRAVGQHSAAQHLLTAAAAEFPDDARPLHELYVQYKKENKHEEAMSALEAAVALDPRNANLQLKLGVECGLVHRTSDAERAYLAALDSEPTLTDAYLGLTVQYEHANNISALRSLISRASAANVAEGTLAFMRAFVHKREKHFADALISISQVPEGLEPERSLHLRAQVLAELGEVDQAFAAFNETNLMHQASPTNPIRRAAEVREKLRKDLSLMDAAWAATWPDFHPAIRKTESKADPVFLVGFPRSGTTLLDTILMGHSQTMVLEEQPPLNLVDQSIGGTSALAGMDLTQIVHARTQYFEEVAKVTSRSLDDGQILIDKSPLFLSKVPTIHRLFPNAKIILALRHPCDVVLSCFMSNFRLNNAMSNFLTLEDTAEFYDLTFQHWDCARSLFPLNVHTVVYERLIDNVEAEMRRLFDFLELEWQSEALNHRETALSRGLITTASYAQVSEPIYRRAAGRWEAYRHHLEPVLPIIKPWVEKFQYTL